MARRVLMADVCGGRTGTTETEVTLDGWCDDGVMMALGSRGMRVEAPLATMRGRSME